MESRKHMERVQSGTRDGGGMVGGGYLFVVGISWQMGM